MQRKDLFGSQQSNLCDVKTTKEFFFILFFYTCGMKNFEISASQGKQTIVEIYSWLNC